MTKFEDVNVGDKVRLTRIDRPTTRHEFEVIGTEYGDSLALYGHETGVFFPKTYTVEVLEHAPKPLPTTRGFYTRPTTRKTLQARRLPQSRHSRR